MGATCKSCKASVGCGCNLVNGLCAACRPAPSIAQPIPTPPSPALPKDYVKTY